MNDIRMECRQNAAHPRNSANSEANIGISCEGDRWKSDDMGSAMIIEIICYARRGCDHEHLMSLDC